MTSADARQHLDPSELGTKQYWEEAYKREITNHTQNDQDQGTIWFEDSGAEDKVVSLLEDFSDDGLLSKDRCRVLDVGTGNGHMLFALRDEDWTGQLVGVDYSPASVELARQIDRARQHDEDASESVRFHTWDLLNDPAGEWRGQGFELVLDKGTFDAISLSDETDARGRRVCESYRERVTPLIKPGGYMIITSCNWTKEELLKWFVVDDGLLLYEGQEVQYPTFTFGGQKGQSVCTLVFRRSAQT